MASVHEETLVDILLDKEVFLTKSTYSAARPGENDAKVGLKLRTTKSKAEEHRGTMDELGERPLSCAKCWDNRSASGISAKLYSHT